MKSLFKIITSATLLAVLTPGLAQAETDMERKLVGSAAWLNNILANSPIKMSTQVLPMSVGNYKHFVESAYSEPDNLGIGRPALSAFLQHGGMVNREKIDVCFLLFNAEREQDLHQQFIASYEANHGNGSAPYIFLAAHELGHCIDFLSPSARDKPPKALEITADCFSILTLRSAGTSRHEIIDIIKSRENSSPTHNTWNDIQKCVNYQFKKKSENIKDIWDLADNLTKSN